jgi:retinol dehydrogenase 12
MALAASQMEAPTRVRREKGWFIGMVDLINSIVTGANSGIGLETARALSQRGDRVFLVCRSRDKGEAAMRDIAVPGGVEPVLILGDLSDGAAVERVGREILGHVDRIDVLVNNAGGYFPNHTTNSQGVEMNLALNHLAYFRLTHALLPALQSSAIGRIVNVASRAHRAGKLDMDDLEFKNRRYRAFVAYGTSKLMNILFTRAFALKYPQGPNMNSVHPGVVRTGFGHDYPGVFSWLAKLASPIMVSASKGAATSVYLATSDEVEGVSGGYYSDCALTQPRAKGRDDALAAELWLASEALCGFKFGQY